MKVGVWNYYEDLNRDNFLFLNQDAKIGEGLLKPFNLLYDLGRLNSIYFNSLDSCVIQDQDAFIFFDFPDLNNSLVQKVWALKKRMYLVIFESELIRPENWDTENHKYFEKIFTWHDGLVDQQKYIKINFSHQIPKTVNVTASDKTRFCTLIASNKWVKHPLELYSKRVEAIRWFEQHHPEQFELYGMGWDHYRFEGPKLVRALNRIKSLTSALAPKYPSYRGKVNSKLAVLSNYRFSICYENARDIPGYITEKIFDSMISGCIPVYWGANNITDHIPKDCFIDKRDFDCYEDLYGYLMAMSDAELDARIQSIEAFLSSDNAYPFSAECFAESIVNTVMKK